MISITSADAQNRFGELIDRAQREPVEVTRRGRPVAYVISGHDIRDFADLRKRREAAVRWYSDYRNRLSVESTQAAATLADSDIDRLVHELR